MHIVVDGVVGTGTKHLQPFRLPKPSYLRYEPLFGTCHSCQGLLSVVHPDHAHISKCVVKISICSVCSLTPQAYSSLSHHISPKFKRSSLGGKTLEPLISVSDRISNRSNRKGGTRKFFKRLWCSWPKHRLFYASANLIRQRNSGQGSLAWQAIRNFQYSIVYYIVLIQMCWWNVRNTIQMTVVQQGFRPYSVSLQPNCLEHRSLVQEVEEIGQGICASTSNSMSLWHDGT